MAELTVKLAQENPGAGFDKIQGMLANLSHEMSDTTVKNILKQHGIEPAPVRTKRTTRAEFLRSHTATMAACDFFTTEFWTRGGLVTFYVFLVMEIATRRVHIAGITITPRFGLDEASRSQPDRLLEWFPEWEDRTCSWTGTASSLRSFVRS